MTSIAHDLAVIAVAALVLYDVCDWIRRRRQAARVNADNIERRVQQSLARLGEPTLRPTHCYPAKWACRGDIGFIEETHFIAPGMRRAS